MTAMMTHPRLKTQPHHRTKLTTNTAPDWKVI
jgi:hypothetical protein